MQSFGSKLKSLLGLAGAVSPDVKMPFYQLTEFTPAGHPVVEGEVKRIRRGKGNGLGRMAEEVKAFVLGRLLSDQEFLRGRIRHDMDEEAPLTNPYDQVAAVYSCVRARAVPISMVPLKVYEWKRNPKTGEEERVEITDHPLADLFFNPNPVTSSFNLKEGTEANLALNGEFFWFLERDEPTDVPTAMWQLPVHRVRPILDRATNLPALWEYKPGPGKPDQIYELHQVVHGKRWSSTSYLRGQGPGRAGRMASAQDWDAQRYNRTFLKNACDPGGTFELPEGVSLDPKQEQKLLKHWEKRHKGPARAGRPGILEGGMKWNQHNIPHRDMRYLQQRKFNLSDLRMVFGVGNIQLGLTDGVAFNTADVQERWFWLNTLFPEMALITDAIWNVFRFIEDGRFEIAFDTSGVAALQKGIDDKTQAAKDLFALGAPASEVNRVLALGLEPWPGWDVSYLPINLLPAGTSTPNGNGNGQDRSLADTLRAVNRGNLLAAPPTEEEMDRDAFVKLHQDLYQVKSPFSAKEDQEYAERFLQTVYRDDEAEFASKYSRWVMEHRVATLRNFKRETEWEGDPTKAVTIPDELRKAIEAVKPKAYEPDALDLLLNLHEGISDRVLSLDGDLLVRILKQANVDPLAILPDPIEWGERIATATRAAYEDSLLTGAGARAGDLGTTAQITSIRVDLARWLDIECTDPIKALSPRLNRAIQQTLVDGILEGETLTQLAVRIKQVHNKAGNRAATIARTEVGKAGEFGAYRESTESGLVEGHWWVPGGANIRESHALMRGQFAALGQPFTTGNGNALLHPHDPDGAAGEVINCKCVLRPRLKP